MYGHQLNAVHTIRVYQSMGLDVSVMVYTHIPLHRILSQLIIINQYLDKIGSDAKVELTHTTFSLQCTYKGQQETSSLPVATAHCQ